MTDGPQKRDRTPIIVGIGIFRLFKALLLIAGGVAALGFMRPETAQRMREWLGTIEYADDHQWLRHLIATVSGMDEKHDMIVAVAAFSYAALFTVEGMGLVLGRDWAEWVTVIATTSFVPFEGYELMRSPSPARWIILILNVSIVIYLVWRIRRRRSIGARGSWLRNRSGAANVKNNE